MTRKPIPAIHKFTVIALSLATFTILFGLASQAQNVRGLGLQAMTGFAADSTTAGFVLPVTYALSGYAPWSVAVADVNGDGKPDLIVVSWYKTGNSESEGSIDVLLGAGDGTFAAPVRYGTLGGQALGVAVGDVNGDSKPDVIVANSCLSLPACNTGGGVSVLLGNGDGTFQPATIYYSGGQGADSVSIADLNGDGHPDLIVANCCQITGTNPGTLGILLGNGDGTFQPAVSHNAGDNSLQSLAVADLNGDGHLDVVAVGESSALVSVLLGNGDGTLRDEVDYTLSGSAPRTITIGDVNADGHPDLVVALLCQDQTCGTGGLNLFFGNGDGTFQAPVSYSAGGYDAASAVIADINGDGNPDLSVANTASFNGPGQVNVLLGNGNGTFQAAASFPSDANAPHDLALADLNGDGKPDAVVVNVEAPAVSILLNNSGAAATTTVLVSSPDPSTYGQSVSLTATVTSGLKTPVGPVIFYDGTSVLGSATLFHKSATIVVASLVAGSHSLLAVFQGSSKFAPSSSSPVIQTVTVASTATSLTSSANPAAVGQTVIYTATVTTQYGGTPTGTITFHDRTVTLATVPLNGNQAVFSTLYMLEVKHLIVATYSGDANNNSSASPVLTEQVGNGATFSSVTTLVTAKSPIFVGESVTFTATVTSAHGPIPDGETVTFYDGPRNSPLKIGSATTSGGVATFTTASLAAGAHTIIANYVGDSDFKSSVGSVKEVVEQYTTATTLTSNENPSHHNDPPTFTVTVISNGGPVPTGTVYITGRIGNVTLNGGTAQADMPNYSPGKHDFIAYYRGDAANQPSKSPVLVQVILPKQ